MTALKATYVRAFWLFWYTLGVGILLLSAFTVWSARTMSSHDDIHAVLIGGVEAIPALLFLIPKTMKVGAVGLLVTILIAFVIHTVVGFHPNQSLAHLVRWDLLIYAAAVNYVRVRGVEDFVNAPLPIPIHGSGGAAS